MTVSGVSKRDMMGNEANEYSSSDVAGIKGHEKDSTNAAMNQIRRSAGYSGDLAIRADDETANEIREREEAMSPANLGRATAGGALHIVAEGLGETAGAGLAVAAGAVAELLAVKHEIGTADALGAATERDHARLAMLSQLDLPAGFKEERIERLAGKHTEGLKGAAQKIAEQIKLDPKAHALFARVQLHADQGMHAALELGKGDFAAYMKGHPEAARRYQEDDAFRQGFDAITWASDAKREPCVLADTVAALHARYARYDVAQVQWRA